MKRATRNGAHGLSPGAPAIAIVGMAFRLPGVSADGLWQALADGENLVSKVEDSRWTQDTYLHPRKAEPGRTYTFAAGSIGDVSGFDAAFFGISPREAAQMDPQQRVLLELAWEAFEDAGIAPSSMRGSRCAVYVGISSLDYGYRRADDFSAVDSTTMTGNTASIAANRLSYVFDLRGPSMAVDTACSSSLVALHQACLSIRSGEASAALVGGISLHLHPLGFIGFSKASMLSPRGVCNVFDAAGDGYVRSEGGAVLLLKRLDDARADGDRILALIAGSGVNCDGKTNGLTVPSAEAQASLLRDVYARAGIAPDEIDYVEAHGTGTMVGDPIETRALGEALGMRRAVPLPIGSVKSNLGHLEAAAGMAGMVKALLAIAHRTVPATIQLTTPNPHIQFAQWNLQVVTQNLPLAAHRAPTIGVNSFGFGGANAHVVLRGLPASLRAAAAPPGSVPPLFVSARSAAALQAAARDMAQHLRARTDLAYYDIAYSALRHREGLEHRLAAWGDDRADIASVLEKYAQGDSSGRLVATRLRPQTGGPVFVYSGNGSQWAGMGRQLLDQDEVFRNAVQDVDALFSPMAGFSILEMLRAPDAENRLELTEVAQPTLFALQVGLTRMLRSWGLEAAAVVGHSVGEVAAAWACGALSLPQAVQVIHQRSAHQGLTKGQGEMTAVALAAGEVQRLLDQLGLAGSVAIAGFNSPRGVTLSGDPARLAEVEQAALAQGVRFKRLELDYAFHSAAMDGIAGSLQHSLRDLRPANGQIAFWSTVDAKPLTGMQLDAAYWWRNVREPVRFQQAIDGLVREGLTAFIEIGPHAVLRGYIGDCLKDASADGLAVPTMLRSAADRCQIERSFLELLAAGVVAVPRKLLPVAGSFVELPRYPWQRERHWHPTSSEACGLLQRTKVHPLLGYPLGDDPNQWESHLDTTLFPAFADHVVGGAVVFPAAGFIEIALAAAAAWRQDTQWDIDGLEIHAPLLLDRDHAKTLRFAVDPADGRFALRSRERLSEDPWVVNVVGRFVERASKPADAARLSLPEGEASVSADAHYRGAEAVGLAYGPAFRTVSRVWVDGPAVIAQLLTPEGIAADLEGARLHPSHVDGAFQLLVDVLSQHPQAGVRPPAFVPIRVEQVRLHRPGAVVQAARGRIQRYGARSVLADFELYAADGSLVATLRKVRFRGVRLTRPSSEQFQFLREQAIVVPRADEVPAAVVPATADLMLACAEVMHAPPRVTARTRFLSEAEPLLDVLCAGFAERALRTQEGDSALVDPQRLIDTGRLVQTKLPLLLRLLGMLEEDGVVERVGDHWLWRSEEALPAPEDVWNSLIADYPEHARLVGMVGHAGLSLRNRLTDDSAALGPSAPFASARLSPDQRGLADLGRVMGSIIDAAAAHQPPGRRLRVLALHSCAPSDGSGMVPPGSGSCEIVVGACSASVQGEIELLLNHRPEADIRLVPICDPDPGLASRLGGPFDIVFLPDGLAGFDAIDQVVANLRRVLLGGGLLMVAEQYPSRAYDLAFGADAPWWSETAAGLPMSRLRSPDHWTAVLEQHGFTCAEPLPDVPEANAGNYLVLARAPDAAPELAEPAAPEVTWLILQDRGGRGARLADAVATHLRAAGQRVIPVRTASNLRWESDAGAWLDPHQPEQWGALIGSVRERAPGPVCCVLMQGWEGAATALPVEARLLEQQGRAQALVSLLQATAAGGATPDITVITRGSAVFALPAAVRAGLHGAPDALDDAPLAGLTRVAINEYPDARIRRIDLADPEPAEDLAPALAAELLHPDAEDEVILAQGSRYAIRLGLGELDGAVGAAPYFDQRTCLEFSAPGSLKNLTWARAPRAEPAAGDVEIRVRAAGLNFRDVMYTMGLLPDEALESGFSGQTLGMELSGVINRVGPGVVDLAVGDEVIAFAPSAFASHVVTRAQAAVRKPKEWSFAAAATVPTAFFTAYYALHELARLREGERILIHGAAGGVGIAAIQLAKSIGAEVFATAGTEEKRNVVRLLGADHVLDSRSLAYADQIMEITAGEGVDAVLNSLAGEAINRNLQVLKPFGRFLELGKRDFYENTRIGLRPMRNNIAYFGIDADQLMAYRPALARSVFLDLMSLFAKGDLTPLPHRSFSALDAVDAFRHMQHSRHIGKIVLDFPEDFDPPVAEPIRPMPLALDGKGSYLVTGGLSGFGLRTAQWLARRGAKRLFLVSRRGASTPEAQLALAELAQAGVAATAIACDITDREALGRVLRRIAEDGHALRGIVHAAMVIDDCLIRNMQPSQLEAVLRPKILGALHLDQLTRPLALDFFVLYSSATTLFGNPGQGNYVAANTFLEVLAEQRRAAGLPATCVAWGPIADAGYLTRNEQVKEALLSRMGGTALSAEQALDVLERLLTQGESNLGVLDLDWAALSRFLPSSAAPKFSDLARRQRKDGAETDGVEDLRRWLDQLPTEELTPALTDILRREVGEILRIAPEKIDAQRSVYDIGMDSLMGVELVTAVESRIGVSLPLMALSEGPTIARLVERIVHQLRPQGAGEEVAATGDALSAQVQRIADQHAIEVGRDEMAAFSAQIAVSSTPVPRATTVERK